ncbi:MAG: TRAP transporter substrate-binding protein DctP, partial [Chloroflexota bacterium]|nr:TRAP transporter substrate-binding protein DctP [Chloroflexota bacterium]
SSCAKPAPAKTIELRYATEEVQTHDRMVNIVLPLHRAIETATNGRLKITEYFSESLIAAPDTYDGIIRGVVDWGEADTQYNPGRFDLTDAAGLPGFGRIDNGVITNTLWDLYKKFPELQKQFSETHLLYLWAMNNDYIWTQKPIKTMEDLKGMKIRANPGPAFDAVKLLGAVPVEVGFNDIYQSMEKKTIDGFIVAISGSMAGKLYEVAKNATNIATGASIQDYAAINIAKWNSLPADIQKIITDMTGDVAVKQFATQLVSINDNYRQKAVTSGVNFITLDPTELARWNKAMAPVVGNYVAKMNAKGLPGQAVADYAGQRIAFWGSQK